MKHHQKVVLIHDVFIEQGGAERVLISLLKIYPTADVIIPLLSSNGKKNLEPLTSGKVITTFFNQIPLINPASLFLKPFLYLYWENLDLSQYNLVISSSHTFSSKSVITGVDTTHISYIHTPPKYLYTEYQDVRILKNNVFKIFLNPLLSWLRTRDFLGGQRPDILIANSKVVQRRIKKYYRRDSVLIYPPVLLPIRSKKSKEYKEYFLCFSRLTAQKGIDLAVQTCKELHLPLLVVGQGSEEAYLKKIAGPTVHFFGSATDAELSSIFSKAHALINCAKDEDFGLVNAEALSFGVPVIGFKSGGTSEVVNARVGVLFEDYSVMGLTKAINQFKKKRFSKADCFAQASHFSESVFERKIKKIVQYEI